MQVAISYFYQIRNFTRYMIPVSTVVWDQPWFHNYLGSNHVFIDKRGIINGLRLTPIIVQNQCENICPNCERQDKDSSQCLFLKNYRNELNKINFKKLYNTMESYANEYKELNHIKEEIIMVLMVYETPQNKCSERRVLIEYFNDNGIKCEELKYPIKDNYI